eukprot:scaffold50838_cov70-Cyclotella_meneghiniana.AAC.5
MKWLPDPNLPTASLSGQSLSNDAATAGQQGIAVDQPSANFLAEMLQNYQAATAGNPLIQQFQAQSLQAMVNPLQYTNFLQGVQAVAANHNVQQFQAPPLHVMLPSQGVQTGTAHPNIQQFQASLLQGAINPSQYAMPLSQGVQAVAANHNVQQFQAPPLHVMPPSQGVQTGTAHPNIQQFQAPLLQGAINPSQYAVPPLVQGNQYSTAPTYNPPLIRNYEGSTAYTIDNETAQRVIQNVSVQESAAAASTSNPNAGPAQQQNVSDFLQPIDSFDLDRKPAAQTQQEASQADSSLTLGIGDQINMSTDRQEELARQSDRLGIQQQSVALLSDPPDDPMLREFAQRYLEYFNSNSDSSGNRSGSSDEVDATNRASQQPPR